MNPFVYTRLADGALRRGLIAAVPRFHLASATAIAHIAEFDARRLYAPEGYPSMSAFCTGELGLTEQVANKLIRVGRTALRFPQIFLALADGRLNPTAVIILAPWLTPENAGELLAAAARRSNDAIREQLADRAPKLDVPLSLVAAPRDAQVSAQTPAHPAGGPAREPAAVPLGDTAETPVVSAQTPAPSCPRLGPLGGGRFETRFTMSKETHDVMRRFEELLGRTVTSEVMDEAARRGLEAMITAFEKRRCGAAARPRGPAKPARGRHVPAEVRRRVWQRDGGRCTFVAGSGRRCEARGSLELDHLVPVACGGRSTLENLRLRCRAHNQFEAERTFGAGFMHEKRERAAAERRARQGKRLGRAAPALDPPPDGLDVTPWLRRLGFRAEEARRAALHCQGLPEASLEQRVRAALGYLAPQARVSGARAAAPPT